jgi:hypothetical protein
VWGKRGSGVRGFHPRAHLGLERDEEAGWREQAAVALGSLVAVLGEQRRAMAAVVACGGERAPRWGPFIAQLGRWGGGGRWPASRGPRRPLMAPGRSCVSRSGARVVLALLKYPFYSLFILDNGMNLISKSLTVLTPA